MLGAAPRRHVYKAVVLLVAISAAVLSSNALGSVRAKTAVNRPQAELWAIGVSAPHASRLSLPRVREFAADGISVIVMSPSGWSSASYRRLADLSVRSGLQLVAPRTDVRSTADRRALSRACHSSVRVLDSCAVMSRNAGQARAWIHRGSVRYVVLPVSSPKAFSALRVVSTPNTHVIGLIKLPTLGVWTSLPAPVAAAASLALKSGGGGGISGGGHKRDNRPPSVPGGLVVSSVGQTSVALTWNASTDNVGVVGYGVYSNRKLVASSTSTGYALAGLTCGTSYSVAVDAYDAAGNRSSRATVTTSTAACPVTQSGAQPPSAPTGIALGTRTTTSISITWTASTDNVGVAGYDLYAGGSEVGTATATATAYTFTGLTCGTSYTLGVNAYDATGYQSPETTGVFSTSACPDTTPPSPPTGLVVSSAGQTSVALTWNASTDNVGVVGYGVYSNGKLVASPTSTGYVLSGLSCGTSYTVAVDADDAAGHRSSQATVTTSTVACPDNQPPTAPAVIALATRTTTNISITWTASVDNVGVVGYDVFADRFAGGTEVGTAAATAYTFTSLTCGTSYTLGVSAYDAAGNYSPETTVILSTSACPPDTAPPSTPTGLASSGVGQTGATLSWTASSDNVAVAGYHLYQGSTQVGTATGTGYAFSALSCGTSYTLGVSAYDAAGNESGRATTPVTTSACATGGVSANLWVNTSAGASPSHCATPCAYDPSHAYGSMDAAYQAASAGDTVAVNPGSYSEQDIHNRANLALGSAPVTFCVASGTVKVTSDLSTEAHDIVLDGGLCGAANVWGGTAAHMTVTTSPSTPEVVVGDPNNNATVNRNVTVENIHMGAFYGVAGGTKLVYDEIGPITNAVCNAPNGPVDLIDMWGDGDEGTPNVGSSIAHDYIHEDYCRSGAHVDGIQAETSNLLVANNRIANCSQLFDESISTPSNFSRFSGNQLVNNTIEMLPANYNDGKGDAFNPGCDGNQAVSSGPPYTVENNTIDGSFNANGVGGGANSVVIGNILTDSCGGAGTCAYNVFLSGSGNGTHAKVCDPVLADGSLLGRSVEMANFPLSPLDTCAVGAGDPNLYPTTDFYGVTRPNPPAAGASEPGSS